MRVLRNYLIFTVCFLASISAILTAWHFPTQVDDPRETRPDEAAKVFYETVYEATGEAGDSQYVEYARETAEHLDITGQVRTFVDQYGLHDKRVLEVGAGSGSLQDLVDDYTGLDIAASAARYFHKPFVQGSATDLPFRDNEFDALWTIWVLEHVPNPERALNEMRRVVPHRGLIYLAPAWNCSSLATQGYQVRSYDDLDWRGKLIKATLPWTLSGAFEQMHLIPTRFIRFSSSRALNSATALRYRPLNPNFETYWVADSDAVNSIDCYEAFLWFTTRGDVCLNCDDPLQQLLAGCDPLIIQVRKPSRGSELVRGLP
jgi:SAM-dependent methyltransferase